MSDEVDVRVPRGVRPAASEQLTVTLWRPPDKQALAFVQSTDKKLASAPYVVTPHGQAFDKQVEVALSVSGQVSTDKVQVVYLETLLLRDGGTPSIARLM